MSDLPASADIGDAYTVVNEDNKEYAWDGSEWSTIGPDLDNYALKSDLAPVATTGNYDDLTNKPTIPTKTSELTNDSGYLTDSDFATVATTGSYTDLIDKPTIPTKTSELTNDSGYLTDADFATVATTGSYTDLTDKPTIPTKTSELTNDSGFITNTVNDLVNYYLKSETYTKTEVNNLIGAISTMSLQVVQALPTEDIQTNVIYLVPRADSETGNIYDEYIYVSDAWEKIGSTDVDLTGYATETWVNTQISGFLTQSQIEGLISTALGNYYTKSEIDTALSGKGTYSKPSGGIPKTDLSESVQASLDKANTAIQDISSKQNITDNNLDTTAKTIVGAINEVNGNFSNYVTKANTVITSLSTLDTIFSSGFYQFKGSTASERINGEVQSGLVLVLQYSGNNDEQYPAQIFFPTGDMSSPNVFYFRTRDGRSPNPAWNNWQKVDPANINATLANKADTSTVETALSGKQATLVSGTNIKTINSQSLLGSGNIVIEGANLNLHNGSGADSLQQNNAIAEIDDSASFGKNNKYWKKAYKKFTVNSDISGDIYIRIGYYSGTLPDLNNNFTMFNPQLIKSDGTIITAAFTEENTTTTQNTKNKWYPRGGANEIKISRLFNPGEDDPKYSKVYFITKWRYLEYLFTGLSAGDYIIQTEGFGNLENLPSLKVVSGSTDLADSSPIIYTSTAFSFGNGSDINTLAGHSNAFEITDKGTILIPNYTDITLSNISGYSEYASVNGVLTKISY